MTGKSTGSGQKLARHCYSWAFPRASEQVQRISLSALAGSSHCPAAGSKAPVGNHSFLLPTFKAYTPKGSWTRGAEGNPEKDFLWWMNA